MSRPLSVRAARNLARAIAVLLGAAVLFFHRGLAGLGAIAVCLAVADVLTLILHHHRKGNR